MRSRLTDPLQLTLRPSDETRAEALRQRASLRGAVGVLTILAALPILALAGWLVYQLIQVETPKPIFVLIWIFLWVVWLMQIAIMASLAVVVVAVAALIALEGGRIVIGQKGASWLQAGACLVLCAAATALAVVIHTESSGYWFWGAAWQAAAAALAAIAGVAAIVGKLPAT